MTDTPKKVLKIPISLSKDRKHKGWVVPRAETLDFLPKLSYEESCDVIIDGIPAKAKLTVLFRLFYSRSKEKTLAEYLDDITTGNDAAIDMQLLLNETDFLEFSSEVNSNEISSLNQKFLKYKQSSEEVKNYLIEINDDLSKKIDNQNEIIDDLKKDNASLSKYIGDLEEKNNILEKRIKYLSQ